MSQSPSMHTPPVHVSLLLPRSFTDRARHLRIPRERCPDKVIIVIPVLASVFEESRTRASMTILIDASWSGGILVRACAQIE